MGGGGEGSTTEFIFDSQESITFVFASSPCVPEFSCFLTRGSLTQIRCNTCSNTICLQRTTAGHNELIYSFYYSICQTIVYFGSNLLQWIVNNTKTSKSRRKMFCISRHKCVVVSTIRELDTHQLAPGIDAPPQQNLYVDQA